MIAFDPMRFIRSLRLGGAKAPTEPATAPAATLPARAPQGDRRNAAKTGPLDPAALYADHLPWNTLPGEADLSAPARDAIARLRANGRWEAPVGDRPSVGDEVRSFLEGGGRPEVAEALLEQLGAGEAGQQLHGKDTCAAAAAMLVLAHADPATYFRIGQRLLAGGTAPMPNGENLIVGAASRTWIESQDFSTGERANALMQAAFMEYANGSKTGYDAATDVSSNRGGQKHQRHGMAIAEFNRLNTALLGAPVLARHFVPAPMVRGLGGLGGWGGWTHESATEQREDYAKSLGEGLSSLLQKHPEGVLVPMVGKRHDHMWIARSIVGDEVTLIDPRQPDTPITLSLTAFAAKVTAPATKDVIGEGTLTAATVVSAPRR